MEEENLTNEVKIELTKTGVTIHVALLKDDHALKLDAVAGKIASELRRKKMHSGDFTVYNPVESSSAHDPFSISWTWVFIGFFGKGTYSKLILKGAYSLEGTADIGFVVTEETRTYAYTKYTPIWRRNIIQNTQQERRSAELDV
jgi:hypothetical protein